MNIKEIDEFEWTRAVKSYKTYFSNINFQVYPRILRRLDTFVSAHPQQSDNQIELF